ncbi:IS1 family transposase [Leptolyngbya subtilissima]|uniref:IS1 family transposase n=1 Tax=Leptolyngbya subtilissima TaxID=1346803 RepID=UPI003D6496D6
MQCDELWTVVGYKGNKYWVWLALDAGTRKIIGAHVDDRSAQSAQRLWDALPKVYRQCAVIYTDAWEAYPKVLPRNRHRVVGKLSGKTSYKPSRRVCVIILACCGILFTTTTHHCLSSTTQSQN